MIGKIIEYSVPSSSYAKANERGEVLDKILVAETKTHYAASIAGYSYTVYLVKTESGNVIQVKPYRIVKIIEDE